MKTIIESAKLHLKCAATLIKNFELSLECILCEVLLVAANILVVAGMYIAATAISQLFNGGVVGNAIGWITAGAVMALSCKLTEDAELTNSRKE